MEGRNNDTQKLMKIKSDFCIDLNKIPNLSHGVNFNFKEIV